MEHDKHDSRDSNQILLNDKDWKYLIASCAPKCCSYTCHIVYYYISTVNVKQKTTDVKNDKLWFEYRKLCVNIQSKFEYSNIRFQLRSVRA